MGAYRETARGSKVTLDINELEEQRKQLFKFSRDVHRQLLHDVGIPFYSATMRTLHKLYRLNPGEIQYQDQTTLSETPITLSLLGTSLLLDQKLREDYLSKMKALDEDVPSDILKHMMIDSVGKYFEDQDEGSKAAEYMKSPVGTLKYDGIKMAREMVIEYYELLHTENAKKMNNLFKNMDETDFPHYQEDIDNIKFIAYTAQEPYHSVFFEHIDQTKIADYNTEVKSKKTGVVESTQYYNTISNKLHLNFNRGKKEGLSDPRGPYITFFHEVGHGIDDVSRLMGVYQRKYKNEDEKTLYDIAKKDVEHNLEETIYEVAKNSNITISREDIDYLKDALIRRGTIEIDPELVNVCELIDREYKKKLDGHLMSSVSDVYGGITNNKIVGNYGHWSKYYWYNLIGKPTKNQSSELFAHVFAISMTNNKEREKVQREYFPKTYLYFEEMIEELKDEME